MKTNKLFNAKFFYPSLLTLFWIFICIIINFTGNFPLGDDWAYAKPVEEFLRTGRMHITDWSSMTLVGHIWWGALFTKIFGFSFDVLRISTLTMALSAILATYCIIRRLTTDSFYGFLGAVIFMISPHFIRYSFSFCTDVTFLGFAFWGIYFLLSFVEEEKLYQYALGVLLIMYSFLIRDVAIVVPPAFALAYGLKNKFRFDKLAAVLIINLLVAAEYFAYRYWLTNIHGMTGMMDYSKDMLFEIWSSGPVAFFHRYTRNVYYSFSYFGYAMLPIAALIVPTFFKRSSKLIWAVLACTAAAGILLALYMINAFGLSHGYFREFLSDFLFKFLSNRSLHNIANDLVWTPSNSLLITYILAITAVGMSLLIISIKNVFDYFQNVRWKFKGGVEFIFLIAAAYYAIILTQEIFGRYLLLPLPLLVGLLLYWNNFELKSKAGKGFFTGIIIIMAFLSLAGTQDFFAFERAKWRGLDYLTNDLKISPKEIDGGFEFNAWHLYDFHYKKKPGKNWWWVEDDKYIVSHGVIPGYRVIKTFDYSLWLPPGRRTHAVVLKRAD